MSGEPVTLSRGPVFALVAVLATLLAHGIHSWSVLRRGFRLYNAEFWVLWVSGQYHDWRGGVILMMLVQAVVTFLLLWAVAKDRVGRWVVWLCCVPLWTCFAFMGEVAIK